MDDGDAAEEIRRLRQTIRNIVVAVVVVAFLVLVVREMQSTEDEADDVGACLRSARPVSECVK